jgi:hypothetical protein
MKKCRYTIFLCVACAGHFALPINSCRPIPIELIASTWLSLRNPLPTTTVMPAPQAKVVFCHALVILWMAKTLITGAKPARLAPGRGRR